jgi:hypothetical protein
VGVKSVLDQQKVRDQDKILAEVAKSLHYIDEPYLLDIEIEGLKLGDVQEAVRSVLKEIKAFHRAGGQPKPITFESRGLVVDISGISPRIGLQIATLLIVAMLLGVAAGLVSVRRLRPSGLHSLHLRQILERLRPAAVVGAGRLIEIAPQFL